MEIGLLMIRCALGGAMFLQGAAKLTRHGHRDTAQYFDGIGFRPAALLAVLVGVTEAGAGILLGVGFATPLAAVGLIAVLVGAVAAKGRSGYWNTGDGYEYPLLVALVASAIAFTGPGEISVDALLGWANPSTAASVVAIVAGIGAAAPLLVRRALLQREAPAAMALQVEAT
jgi:putative oxidoreductase